MSDCRVQTAYFNLALRIHATPTGWSSQKLNSTILPKYLRHVTRLADSVEVRDA